MASSAAARETIVALRRKIASIEGRIAERLETPAADSIVMRVGGDARATEPRQEFLTTGAESLDLAMGGGVPRAALTEIHTAQTRDAGAASGFALGLAARMLEADAIKGPILWIATGEMIHEAGCLYLPGLRQLFGIRPGMLLTSQVNRLSDALWVAEEAAPLPMLAAVFLELRGNPSMLDLTATRRLHSRAREAGRPVFLMRQAALAEPTAAPVRLIVTAAAASDRWTVAGPVEASIGRPAFSVRIGKSRSASEKSFVVEWNTDDLSFQERRAKNSVPLVSLPQHRADHSKAPGTVLALQSGGAWTAPDRQPPGTEHPARHGGRRAG